MSYSRIGRWLRKRSPLVTLVTVAPAVVIILGLTACVEHPIGDPEESKVNPEFVGTWSSEDSLLFFRPYDARTYLISAFTYSETDGEFKARTRIDYKAWLTPVGDETFITMQPLTIAHFVGLGKKPPYFVAQIHLVDDKLQLRLVNAKNAAVKEATNSRELEAAIKEHMSSDSLYVGDLTVLKKVDDTSRIKAVLEVFPAEFSF